jgi:hypothetical protein
MRVGKPHHKAVDITGVKLNSLTAVSYAGAEKGKSIWNLRCDCGNEILLASSEFKKGKQKSCGCQRAKAVGEANTKHGYARSPMYAVWRSMIDRCKLPTHQAWHNYGGRGISVCEKWRSGFMAFWEDMGSTYVKGLTLERIDVNGNYTPENCAWTTCKKQARNKRNNVLIETPWGLITVAEAAERSGIGVTTLHYRLQNCPRDFLFTKPDVRNRFTTL